jgi:hypothetical protein
MSWTTAESRRSTLRHPELNWFNTEGRGRIPGPFGCRGMPGKPSSTSRNELDLQADWTYYCAYWNKAAMLIEEIVDAPWSFAFDSLQKRSLCMSDTVTIVVGLLGPIGLLALVAHLLERRARAKGPLFTGPPSRGGQFAAFLLAIIFLLPLIFLAFDAASSSPGRPYVHVPILFLVPAFLSVALAAYALGASKMLRDLQTTRWRTILKGRLEKPNESDSAKE